MENAERFGAALGDVLRGMAPAARLENIRYVPASGLRMWSYQTFAHLGAEAHQRPWVGLPKLVLFALPLALLTLLVNLFAAARAGGPASSLEVEVRIANGEW